MCGPRCSSTRWCASTTSARGRASSAALRASSCARRARSGARRAGPPRLRLATRTRRDAFAALVGGLPRALARRDALGAPRRRRPRARGTRHRRRVLAGHARDPTVELWPVTPTAIYRGLAGLLPTRGDPPMTPQVLAPAARSASSTSWRSRSSRDVDRRVRLQPARGRDRPGAVRLRWPSSPASRLWHPRAYTPSSTTTVSGSTAASANSCTRCAGPTWTPSPSSAATACAARARSCSWPGAASLASTAPGSHAVAFVAAATDAGVEFDGALFDDVSRPGRHARAVRRARRAGTRRRPSRGVLATAHRRPGQAVLGTEKARRSGPQTHDRARAQWKLDATLCSVCS